MLLIFSVSITGTQCHGAWGFQWGWFGGTPGCKSFVKYSSVLTTGACDGDSAAMPGFSFYLDPK